jgi:hypothetical protein
MRSFLNPIYLLLLFFIFCPLNVKNNVFLSSFCLDTKRSKKVKIVVRFCPHARAGPHDNQATAF